MKNESDVNMLSCPCCSNQLVSTGRCDSCGLKFEEEDGTPVLIAPNANRHVKFTFTSNRSYISDDLLQLLLTDPPVTIPGEKLPYHLDPAHVYVINRLPKGNRVLEIGCGGGQNRKFFEDKGWQYVGVDISKVRVFDWLQKSGGPDYLCDAHFLPFLDQQFDVVYCAAVFEHLACPFLAAQEVYRVVKPGGYFLGNVSFLEPWHDKSYFHMTPLGVIELLTQAEFHIENIWPGRGYSGYYAIAAMGSRSTKLLKILGIILYLSYRMEHKLKALLRSKKEQNFKDILNRAKVAGAIDWIAFRPDKQNSN
jgi:ubiquinone/menaquinone biosynthesis C-methylase UbiE